MPLHISERNQPNIRMHIALTNPEALHKSLQYRQYVLRKTGDCILHALTFQATKLNSEIQSASQVIDAVKPITKQVIW